jgi:ligand-binding sensor domain-containing protein
VLSPRFFTPGLVLATALLAAVFGRASLHAAADGDLAVQIWSIEQGLPNSTVTALAQTRDGYLWVGTFNGLARFDGVRFVTFNPANTPAMKHARVQRLYVDSEDTLWINTYDGALISLRDGVFAEEWKSSCESARGENIPGADPRTGNSFCRRERGIDPAAARRAKSRANGK